MSNRKSRLNLYLFYLLLAVGVSVASFAAIGLAVSSSTTAGRETGSIHNYTAKIHFTVAVEKSLIYPSPIVEFEGSGQVARKLTRSISVRVTVYRDGKPLTGRQASYTATSYAVVEPFLVPAETHSGKAYATFTVKPNLTKLRETLKLAEQQAGIPPTGKESYQVNIRVEVREGNRSIVLNPKAYIAAETPYVYSLTSTPDSKTVREEETPKPPGDGGRSVVRSRRMLLSVLGLGLLLVALSPVFYARHRREDMDEIGLLREKAPILVEGRITYTSATTIVVDNVETLARLASKLSSPVILDRSQGLACTPISESIIVCSKTSRWKQKQ